MVVFCLQVPILISKIMILVESLLKNEISLHGFKPSFIIPSSGGKNIISMIIVWLYRLLREAFLLVVVFCSPLESSVGMREMKEMMMRYEDRVRIMEE